ncbi:MAG: DUF4058 family protein [Armatimonadota bacterium]
MLGPFPGMDPYLEAPDLWRGLHLQLIAAVVTDLQPQLVPRYVARAEERVLLEPLAREIWPDIKVRERGGAERATAVAARPSLEEVAVPEYVAVPELGAPSRWVEVLDVRDRAVVTVIELLSPWNKSGLGAEQYRRKQEQLLFSGANLVEIDLLRRGRHTVAVPEALIAKSDYRVCLHRAGSTGFEVVRFGVRDPLPNTAIPLRAGDDDAVLHLGAVFESCYRSGAYAFDVDYSREPEPALSADDAEWARERIERWRESG